MPEPDGRMKRLEEIASLYDRDVFNKVLIRMTEKIIVPRVQGKIVLELGCAELTMSLPLAAAAARLDVVEGAEHFVKLARENLPKGSIYHSLFETFEPERKYEAIILANTLHHIEAPQLLLRRVREWLLPGGSFHVTVPNMFSLHRRIGVKMGMLKDVFGTTERNVLFAQQGRFTKELLINLLKECDFEITDTHAFFLKPFSDAQMAMLNLPQEAIDALFELGREFEELASQIYVEAKSGPA